MKPEPQSKLVQLHMKGYFAPPIYGHFDQLKEFAKHGKSLVARFPNKWKYYIYKN